MSVTKKTTLGLFQNAIEIATSDQVRVRDGLHPVPE
jgi:hypothetical protein